MNWLAFQSYRDISNRDSRHELGCTRSQESDKPRRLSKYKIKIVLCFVVVLAVVGFSCSYLTSSNLARWSAIVRNQNTISPTLIYTTILPHHFIGNEYLSPFSTPPPCEDQSYPSYNFLGNDTLIVIHIQKTGGTDFLRHLVTIKKEGRYLCQLPNDLVFRIEKRQSLPKGSKQRISCPKSHSDPNSTQWLLSEKTRGWVCGVHPTYSEYKKCLGKLDVGTNSEHSHYRFMTILRHPVLRYLSEFEHVVRGAHWPTKKKCGGRKVNQSEMPPCYPGFYNGRRWENVTLADFMSCKSNWANNRQVVWLADLEAARCFDPSFKDREKILLSTAKCNIDKLTFFGLTEYQNETFFMFEKMFNVTFSAPPIEFNVSNLHSTPMLQKLWRKKEIYDKIAAINHLDMQLYEHALRLFAHRAEAFGLKIDLQKVDHDIRRITSINVTSKKFLKGKFDLPQNT